MRPGQFQEIVQHVSDERGVPTSAILGTRGAKDVASARQEVMWRLRELRRSDGRRCLTTTRIGELLGRVHTTVSRGIRAHAERMGQV